MRIFFWNITISCCFIDLLQNFDPDDILRHTKAQFAFERDGRVEPIADEGLSFRRHLIYVAEISCETIDINDFYKTALSLQVSFLHFTIGFRQRFLDTK